MKKLFKDLSIFRKLLYSYLAILLVSVVAMVLFTNTYFIGTIKEELISRNEETLSNLKSNMDMNISEMEDIKDRITLSGDYASWYQLRDTASIIDLQEELIKYVGTNSFIYDIAVYIDNDEYIYSSKSSYKIPFFIETAYRYENWSEEELIKDLTTLTAPYVRAEERVTHFSSEEKELITFIYPLYNIRLKKCGAMIFFVDKESINKLAAVNFSEEYSSVYILDRNNNVIARSSVENDIFEESIKEIDKSNSSQIKRIDGEDYLVSVVESESNGWRYVSFTKEKTALGRGYSSQKMVIFIFIIIMLLGSVIIYHATKLNYKPIQRLKSYADLVKPGNGTDEISAVIDTIDYLNDKNSNLINSFTDITKEHIIDNLLKGNVKILEAEGCDSEDIGISFEFDYYLTAVLLFHNSADIDTLFEKVRALVENNYNGWAKNYHDRNKIVLILTSDTAEVDYTNISRLHMEIKEIAKTRVSMGVGEICFGIEDIPNSYMQASTALDYRVIKGADKVIFHDEIQHNDDSFDEYPHKELKILNYKLKEGDVKEIEAVLADIIDYVVTCNVSLFIARGLCFDLINTICEAVSELNQEFIVPKKYYINVDHITKYETVGDLMESVRNICTNLCALITENKSAQHDNLIAELVEFVEKNYTNVNFSVQTMADEFGMSMTNLSQYFKNHTGNTINDYVTGMRIKKAQELLITTNKPLTEITEEVGYINTSSFIRRFKQITGVTPGQYAKMNKL